MPYLNLDINYFDHPKTRRLMAILGPGADVYPIRLWAYCAKIHPRDGAMKGYSEAEVNGILGTETGKFTGSEGSLSAIQAMIKVGFIKQTSTGFCCVDWRDHEGHLDAFSRRGKEANKRRWDMVRSGIPVGVQKRKIGNPPTELAVLAVPTELAIPTEPTAAEQQPFDAKQDLDQKINAIAASKATAHRADHLLALTWKVKGAAYGLSVQDLEPDYCRWALNNLTGLGQEYKDALAVRLEQKTSEAIK